MTGPRSLVIDASVAVKWFVPEAGSTEARALLDRSERWEVALLAPELVLIETAHVLRGRVRQGEVTVTEARTALDRLFFTFSRIVPDEALVKAALGISFDLPVSVYDALYVALANRDDAELVTADRRLAAAVPRDIAAVTLLADFEV